MSNLNALRQTLTIHLSLLQPILDRQFPAGAERTTLLAAKELTQRQLGVTDHQVAVVGEFSSGKTTFINALLREPYLKADIRANTASATFIKNASPAGVEVFFKNGETIDVDETRLGGLSQKLERHRAGCTDNVNTLKDLINLLTADAAIAATIKRMTIFTPRLPFEPELTIIDTPGLSEGDHTGAARLAVTEEIIRNAADRVIVLIPSTLVISNSLLEYLKTTLKRQLHRCIFLITAMDRIAEPERAELLRFAAAQIKDKLGLPAPMILHCCAISMLPVADHLDFLQAELPQWQEGFRALELQLNATLCAQRAIINLEKAGFLSIELFDQAEKFLKAKQEEHRQKDKTLGEAKPPTMANLFAEFEHQAGCLIEEQRGPLIRHAISRLGYYQRQAKDAAATVVNVAGNNIIYPHSLAKNVEAAVIGQSTLLGKETMPALEGIPRCCDELLATLKKTVARHYRNLPLTQQTLDEPELEGFDLETPALDLSAVITWLEESTKKKTSNKFLRGVIGGLIGGVLGLGPGGAVAGAAIAVGTGSGASVSIPVMRSKALELINTAVDSYFHHLGVNLRAVIDQIINELPAEVERVRTTYKEKNGRAVAEVQQQHDNKVRDLRVTIHHFDTDLAQLKEMRQVAVRSLSELEALS